MSAGLAQSFRSHTVKKMQNPNNIWFWLRMLNSLCLVDKQQNIFNQNCSSVIGIQPSIDVVLIWIFTATLCRIEAPCTFLSNDLWVLSRPQMLEDCWSSALWCLLCPFSSSPFGFVCPSFLSALFFFWLFVMPDSPQSPKLLLSLNSSSPLVQGRLGRSTTGLFVGLGRNACRPEYTWVVYLFFLVVYLCEYYCLCACTKERTKKEEEKAERERER